MIVDYSTEEWRPVAGREGAYEVSSLGRVRSLPRRDLIGRRVAGGILKTPPNGPGYPQVSISHRDVRLVHVLVADAFLGPRPEGTQIRHLNGNPADNRAVNLAYGTQSDNNLDTVRHGRNLNAARTHCPQGHPYDEQNTYILPSRPAARYCRACHRTRSALTAS